MSEDFQPLRTCRRCKELRPDLGAQTMGICGPCASETATPKLRKCARCGLHKPDWHSTAAYCPQCWREYQRERRAARKAEGRREWSVKTCSQCGAVESMPPENGWCRTCRNKYQRDYKRQHLDAYELPPQAPQPVNRARSVADVRGMPTPPPLQPR